MRFDTLLVERGLVSAEQLAEIRSRIGRQGRLEHALVEMGLVEEGAVLALMGEALGLDVLALKPDQIPKDCLQSIPAKTIFKSHVIPVERQNGTLRVATSSPFDLATMDEIHAATGLEVEPVLVRREEIAAAIKFHFGVGGETVGALLGDASDLLVVDADGANAADDDLAEEASVIKLVNEILTEAIEQRTSDVHIEPTEKGLRIRYRIDGVLQVQALPPAIHRFAAAIVSRLKIMAKLNIAEKRLPQDGRIQLRVRGREVDIRVSIIPMAYGEGVVLRILDKGSMTFRLEKIGMRGAHYELWSKLIELPHGILLVTGPTGSGKTTTLYCALQEIARDDNKIITIEDPVEYHFDRIQQIQVHPKIGLTFAAGLRSILRHDPDVVLIGEIRDIETAEIAVQASLTGHLVFSTLHTNDAASAFTRLTDMGVEPFLVASTVEAVLAQRLVRMICADCKESYQPEPSDLPNDFPFPADGSAVSLHRGKGCRTCHQTGYRGRQGIFELLPISDAIREMVVARASSTKIKAQAISEGLVTLRRDAWAKLNEGLTTLEEVLRVTKSDTGLVARVPAMPVSAGLVDPVPSPSNPLVH